VAMKLGTRWYFGRVMGSALEEQLVHEAMGHALRGFPARLLLVPGARFIDLSGTLVCLAVDRRCKQFGRCGPPQELSGFSAHRGLGGYRHYVTTNRVQ